MRRNVAAAVAALVLLGVGLFLVLRDGARPGILLIGIDGADWDILDPLIEAGRLPNLTQLRQDGVSGPLTTLRDIPLSPVIWTSIATGKGPDQHGITWFLVDTPDGERIPVRSNQPRRRGGRGGSRGQTRERTFLRETPRPPCLRGVAWSVPESSRHAKTAGSISALDPPGRHGWSQRCRDPASSSLGGKDRPDPRSRFRDARHPWRGAILGHRLLVYLRPGHILSAQVLAMLDAIEKAELDLVAPFILVAERRRDQIRVRVRRGHQ